MAKVSELPPVLVLEKDQKLSTKLAEEMDSLCSFSFNTEKALIEHLKTQNQAIMLIGSPFCDKDIVKLVKKFPKTSELMILVAKAFNLEIEEKLLKLENIWVEGISLRRETMFWARFNRMRSKLMVQKENESLRHHLEVENKKWEESKEFLEHHNSELMQFTHTVAHDLNHPLSTINSYMELLHDMLPEESSEPVSPRQIVERVQRSSRRLVAMIRGMLRFANNTDEEGGTVSEVDLNEVLDSVLEDLDVQIRKHKAKVDVGEMPIIMGSHTQIYQVFLNLISNAIKFNKSGTQPLVKIHSDILDDRKVKDKKLKICRIYISDNGIGIEPSELGSIFTPFSRIDSNGPVEGTGVGLATVKRIVSKHAGSIQVNSELGKGSTFILSFPIQLVRKAMPFLRKELRIECLDERMIQSVMLSPGKKQVALKVVNESENGLCCECPADHQFEVGSIIEVAADKKYQVRWLKSLPCGTGQLGLKIVQ